MQTVTVLLWCFGKKRSCKVFHLQGDLWKRLWQQVFSISKINLPACGRNNNEPFKCFPPALHSSIVCHGRVTGDVFLFSFPTSIKWAHYIDAIMLTCEDSPLLQDTLQALLECLQGKGWQVNPQKTRDAVTTIEFLKIVWSSEMCVVLEAVIDKIHIYATSKNVKEMPVYVVIWGL